MRSVTGWCVVLTDSVRLNNEETFPAPTVETPRTCGIAQALRSSVSMGTAPIRALIQEQNEPARILARRTE